MLLSRHWLNRYLDLKGVRNKQITKALNDLGFEVENTIDLKEPNESLIIGRIEQSVQIPGTHLSKNRVNIGGNKELSIICGAPNVKRNQYVIVAKPGQKMADGITINPRLIKGEMSNGMICALNEIGFANNHLTIEEQNQIYDLGKLNSDNLLGQPASHFAFDDFIWEIDLTLNRSDALSAFQLAKELAHYFKVSVKWPIVPSTPALLKPKTEIRVTNEVKDHIISLIGKSVEVRNNRPQISVTDDLLLKKVGIKTTDNLYEDLVNLNAWETGQPLILIDRNKLLGTLNFQMVSYHGKKLLGLTSNGELVKIVGQPTTANFSVDENTKTILVLALKIDENFMRHQSRYLPPSTALQRYSKPISLSVAEMGLKNYERLLADYRLLRAKSPLKIWIKAPINHYQILTSIEQINCFLGTTLSTKELINLLKNSDLVTKIKNGQLMISPNPVRTDLTDENSVIGEVARLYGYDKIPSIPLNVTLYPHQKKWTVNMQYRIQDYLNALGFSNVKTYSLINKNETNLWNIFNYSSALSVSDPLSLEHTNYRLSLVPSLLKIIKNNVANGHKNFKLWEIADVYSSSLHSHRHLIIAIGGQIVNDPLNHQLVQTNYSYIKGLVEAIVNFYGLDTTQLIFEPFTQNDSIHPLASAVIKYKTKILGFIFRFTQQFYDQHKLPMTYIAELNLDYLSKFGAKAVQNYHPLNKFQVSKRTLTFLLPNNLIFSDVIKQITHHIYYLTDWVLIDHYQDKAMAANQEQALSVSFSFNHPEHQLTEAEINHQWNRILANTNKIGLKTR